MDRANPRGHLLCVQIMSRVMSKKGVPRQGSFRQNGWTLKTLITDCSTISLQFGVYLFNDRRPPVT